MARNKRINAHKVTQWAREVLQIEKEEVQELFKRLDVNFVKAVSLLYSCRGRVVVSGMGKAGIIGQKFSATLSSTGTPSLWVHPAEAAHGDLGRITPEDVVVIFSYSGHTDEVKKLLPLLKKIGAKIVSLTGNLNSPLAKYSDTALDISVRKEACPLNLAPTASTTAMLALSDALAVCVQKLKGFKKEDFALFHPAGALGKRLLLTVEDIMRKDKQNPLIQGSVPVKEVLVKITQARAGAATIVDKKKKIKGIFTDGDLRRNLERYSENLLKMPVEKVMTKNPKTINKDMLESSAAKIMQDYKIDEIPVVNSRFEVVGMLDIQDLLEAGII